MSLKLKEAVPPHFPVVSATSTAHFLFDIISFGC